MHASPVVAYLQLIYLIITGVCDKALWECMLGSNVWLLRAQTCGVAQAHQVFFPWLYGGHSPPYSLLPAVKICVG
jgi:hypothetical protein